MLKKNYILSLALLLSAPIVAMENPAVGHLGQQQIITAVRIGNLAQLQELKRTNPTIDLNNITDRGFGLVLITAMQNKVDMMHYLLRVLLLNPNVTFNGQNALHLAASRGHLDMVKYLVGMAKFDTTTKDNGGKTALDLAKANNKAEVVTYLSSNAVKKAVRPLPPTPAKPAAKPAPKQTVKPVTKSCIICAEDRQPNQFITLGCGHEYCRECLGFMLDNAIKDKNTRAFKCPTPKCNHLLEEDLHKITQDHAKLAQLSEIQLQEYLIKDQHTKNCPTPNCGFSFINERADQFTMQCPDCKKEYCGKCLHKHESTTSCQQAEQDRALVNDRNAQERANREWQLAHTKPCPRCRATTEKAEGCNRMTCSQCNHSYCWNCLGPWDMTYYRCKNQCGVDTFDQAQMPAAPRQAQQQEQITWQNAHTHFARDPRGFINSARGRYDVPNVTIEFAERFMRLSCADQVIWVERINQLVRNNPWNYQYQIQNNWLTELARFEPVTLTIINYYQLQEGTFNAQIAINRDWHVISKQLQDQIKQWIINQNPQDLILFNEWTCETSLTRERLQEVLNQASRHFRNNRELQQAQPQAAAPAYNNGNYWAAHQEVQYGGHYEEAPAVDYYDEAPVIHYQQEPPAPRVNYHAPARRDKVKAHVLNMETQKVNGNVYHSTVTLEIPITAQINEATVLEFIQALGVVMEPNGVQINVNERRGDVYQITLTSNRYRITRAVIKDVLDQANRRINR